MSSTCSPSGISPGPVCWLGSQEAVAEVGAFSSLLLVVVVVPVAAVVYIVTLVVNIVIIIPIAVLAAAAIFGFRLAYGYPV